MSATVCSHTVRGQVGVEQAGGALARSSGDAPDLGGPPTSCRRDGTRWRRGGGVLNSRPWASAWSVDASRRPRSSPVGVHEAFRCRSRRLGACGPSLLSRPAEVTQRVPEPPRPDPDPRSSAATDAHPIRCRPVARRRRLGPRTRSRVTPARDRTATGPDRVRDVSCPGMPDSSEGVLGQPRHAFVYVVGRAARADRSPRSTFGGSPVPSSSRFPAAGVARELPRPFRAEPV